MSAADRLEVTLGRNEAGDWVMTLDGRPLVGVLWDEDDPAGPVVVVWDAAGEADGRVFPLSELRSS